MGTNAGTVFVGGGDVVGADGDKAAIADLELAMELHESFALAPVLGAEAAPAQHENHGVRALEFRQFAALGGQPLYIPVLGYLGSFAHNFIVVFLNRKRPAKVPIALHPLIGKKERRRGD